MTASALSTGPSFAIPALVSRAAAAVSGFVRAWRNRLDATILVEADARMLADLGLTRSDLRDAFAQPLWRDPTSLLHSRAGERRRRRPAS
jgi:uncharacterized protein YjiS (DUF1127 family)